MDSNTKLKGSCLCGSVKLSFDFENDNFHACHCGYCRKWGGGPLLSVDSNKNLKFEGEEFVGVYSSSEWAERGFCKNCGSHLFYRLKDGNLANVPLGILENPQDFKLDVQIFIDKKLPNYNFAEKTHMMTEAEVFAQFAP